MPFDDEVVSPELVLIAPELASVTWRREDAPAQPVARVARVAPGRARPASRRSVIRAVGFSAVAVAGLILGMSLSVQPRTAAASTPPPATRVSAPGPRTVSIVLPTGRPRDVSDLAVSVTRTSVGLSWRSAPGSPAVVIVRSPGLVGRRPSSIYEGSRSSFVDSTVRAGTEYRYVVYAITRGPHRSPGVPATVRP